MSITWSKYFDRIYCLHFVPYTKRKELLEVQLKRVGILDSGIFEYQYVYNNNVDKKFETYFHNLTEQTRNDIYLNESITFGHYKVIRDAYYRGYNRILILEDDVRFLRDLNKIEQYFINRPEDADFILYDKFIWCYNDNQYFKPYSEHYSIFKRCQSACCYEINRNSMERLINLIEERTTFIDNYFNEVCLEGLHYYCSNTNIAIQCMFNDSINMNKNHPFDPNDYQRAYKYQNIDFDDYMMRADGKAYYYGDYIDTKEKQEQNPILKISDTETVNKNEQIKSTSLDICLSITTNHFNKLPVLIYSIQKYSKSKLNFHIILNTNQFDQYKLQLDKLKDDRTTFNFIDGNFIESRVNNHFNHWKTMMAYAKLFLAEIFPNLDRIMYLDYDTLVVKEGIEWLYNMDFEDKYVIASYDIEHKAFPILSVIDIALQEWKVFRFLTSNYFNSGVMVLNLKKIREDGKDKQIYNFLLGEPPDQNNNKDMRNVFLQTEAKKFQPKRVTLCLCDQSVFNFIFRNEDVKIVSPIFNNLTVYLRNIIFEKFLKQKYNFKNEEEFMNNTIICHFLIGKPWELCPENSYLYIPDKLKFIDTYNKIKTQMQEKMKND